MSRITSVDLTFEELNQIDFVMNHATEFLGSRASSTIDSEHLKKAVATFETLRMRMHNIRQSVWDLMQAEQRVERLRTGTELKVQTVKSGE